MSLIGLLVALVVFGIVLWAARALMGAFGIGEPIATVVHVLLVVVFLVFLLGLIGIGPGLRLT